MRKKTTSDRLEEFRWWLAEKLVSLAERIDPDLMFENRKNQDALKVLSKIARQEIPIEDAAREAYIALY